MFLEMRELLAGPGSSESSPLFESFIYPNPLRPLPVERAGDLGLLLRHPEPFFGHGKPVVFVGLSTAPFGLPDALLGTTAIFLSLGHRRHF
jgi:hypothetical protein